MHHRHITIVKLMVFLLLFAGGTVVKAQILVSVPDTTLTETVKRLVLNISGSLPAADSVRLHFTYNSSRLNILNISGGRSNVITCAAPSFDSTAGESTGELIVQCDAVTGGTGTLLELEFEIVNGIDSIARITPDSVIINGKQEQFTAKSGSVVITGQTVREILIEGVEQNSPNPFYLNSDFYYTVEQDSPVHFRIYTSAGQLVRDFDVFTQTRGRHRFIVNAQPGEFASGSYYLTMTTNSGSYVAHLLCLK